MGRNTKDDVLDFFEAVRIPFRFGTISTYSFLPGILIQEGRLVIDMELLRYPGDLLHEAGHIAVTPTSERRSLTGDVHKCGHGPADEMAAIAWSWAALQKMGGDPEFLFHAQGYKGGSKTYIQAFSSGGGFGYPLLAWYGMTEMPGHPEAFPKMKRWLRP